MTTRGLQFDFGQNWQDFSAHALNPERVAQARDHFLALLTPIEVRDRTFLDIGFGQGLSLLLATARGARAVGCDINPKCAAVLADNRKFFSEVTELPSVVVGSILEKPTVDRLRALSGDQSSASGFDIVHSWGVLHHTGNMRLALENAANLVAPRGYFIVAIYNRHWSSGVWAVIKHLYVLSPRWLQKTMVAVFCPIIYAAKWLVTGKNPRRQERGMEFFYNVIDWVGGYPYEYASRQEMIERLSSLGFALEKEFPAIVPTGCNEFVFRRRN